MTSITPTMKLQRIDQVVATDMEGETIMVDFESGNYFALTGSGSHIWAALENPVTVGHIIHTVQQEFDTEDFQNLGATVTEFVEDLVKNKLVIAAD